MLWQYASPVAGTIGMVVCLTLVSNVLALANPAIMAALVGVIGLSAKATPVASGALDLNSLGGWIVEHWLLPITQDQTALIGIVAGAYLGQVFLVSVMEYGILQLTLRIRTTVCRSIQADALRHLLQLPLMFFRKQKSGDLVSLITQDAANTANGVGPLVRSVLNQAIQLIGYGFYLFSTSSWLSLAAVGVLTAHLGFSQILKRPIKKAARQISEARGALSTGLQEAFAGIHVAKVFGAEAFEMEKLVKSINGLSDAAVKQGKIEELEQPVRSILDAAALMTLLLIAAWQLRQGLLTIQGFILFLYVGRLMMTPMNRLATNYVWWQALSGSFERIGELLSQPQTLKSGPKKIVSFQNSIFLKDVSFSYDRLTTLKGVNLRINRGEMVALVGPSGAGKSTLADLILRLHDPQEGKVQIDDIPVEDLNLVDYRKLFGVVPQESFLFHESVLENIRYGRLEISEYDIREAARVANADLFIDRLPSGYRTVVGDRGVRLSGGERQRVAIARAVAHRPQILILDEATSSLDSESEAMVQQAIDRITEQTTAIVIAHRFSTVLRADRIVVLDDGHIIDQGKHGELIPRCALYRKLYEMQFKDLTETVRA